MNQQLEKSERLIADFGKRNTELEKQLRVLRNHIQDKDVGAKAGAADFKLRWREGEEAPIVFDDAVVDNTTNMILSVKFMPTMYQAPAGLRYQNARFCCLDFLL